MCSLRAAMRIPALESLFPEPWPAAARRVLPSHSPHLTATAMWGPVLAWSVLELLAESVNADDPSAPHSICLIVCACASPWPTPSKRSDSQAEESWRVAARIKVALLIEAKVFAPVRRKPRTSPLPSGMRRRSRSRSRFSRPRSGRIRMFAGSPARTKRKATRILSRNPTRSCCGGSNFRRCASWRLNPALHAAQSSRSARPSPRP